MGKSNLVRFDWAAKRLLRNKSNFVVLEGFLSVLLEDEIHIERILESEGNQQKFDDKFNRVDMLAENSKGELVIIEVQYIRDLVYFHRLLYGTSKAITEYINQGDPYAKVKKVYSVNIVYFDLGQGDDYVYHGYTEFRGIHTKDVLRLSVQQQEQFVCHDAGDLFPEYYVLRVDEFDKLAKTPLDEWILILKTGEIAENVTASGLREARERLRVDKLSDAEQKEYERHMEALRYQRSVIQTGWIEGKAEGKAEGIKEGKAEGRAEGIAEGIKEGKAEGIKEGKIEGMKEGERKGKLEVARSLKQMGLSVESIAVATGLSIDDIEYLE